MIHHILICVFLLTVPSLSQNNSALNSNYQMKIGDYCALLLFQVLKANSELDSPLLSTFDIENNNIELKIFGARGTVEGARETLNVYWENIEVSFIPYVEKRFSLLLNKEDFKISYYNRNDRYKLIVQLINGQIVVPSN
jgi:hypothetical protein